MAIGSSGCERRSPTAPQRPVATDGFPLRRMSLPSSRPKTAKSVAATVPSAPQAPRTKRRRSLVLPHARTPGRRRRHEVRQPQGVSGCAVYTRVSTEHGLEQEFNSLDNQREASEAYVKSQAHEGWRLMRDRYDDGGFSGGSMDRPALKKLLDAVRARRVDVIVV